MPPSFAIPWLIKIVPEGFLKEIRNLFWNTSSPYIDLSFMMLARYLPAALLVMVCISFCNEAFRDIDIDCESSESKTIRSVIEKENYAGSEKRKFDHELNDYCWNQYTFLVKNALDPKMRGEVTFPGVDGYRQGKDELLYQNYYKHLWLYLLLFLLVARCPEYLWKLLRGPAKIEDLINHKSDGNASWSQNMVANFLESIGFNSRFAMKYFICKILATACPIFVYFLGTICIGNLFESYGLDVIKYKLDKNDPWPDPMDALFPKVAKCENARYGQGGSKEFISAQCKLPMNNATQWTFFVFWWILAIIFIFNLVSLIYYIIIMLATPEFCNWQYRKIVRKCSPENLEKARGQEILKKKGNGNYNKRLSKSDVIYVKLGYGDWFVLSLMIQNMAEPDFREFIRELVTTKNKILQFTGPNVEMQKTQADPAPKNLEVPKDAQKSSPGNQKIWCVGPTNRNSVPQTSNNGNSQYPDSNNLNSTPQNNVDKNSLSEYSWGPQYGTLRLQGSTNRNLRPQGSNNGNSAYKDPQNVNSKRQGEIVMNLDSNPTKVIISLPIPYVRSVCYNKNSKIHKAVLTGVNRFESTSFEMDANNGGKFSNNTNNKSRESGPTNFVNPSNRGRQECRDFELGLELSSI